jgi:hypothetical protein
VSHLLSNFFCRFALAGGGPSFVGGNSDGGDGSAVHAGKSNELAVGIGDGDHYGFFGLGSFFDDQVDDFFGLGVVDDGEIPHRGRSTFGQVWGEIVY